MKICGIDEAGRGPLAGPVCAASVCLSQNFSTIFLRDSKKLSFLQRSELFRSIIFNNYWGVGWATVEEIDRYNIFQATFLAMKRAYEHMKVYVDVKLALIDGKYSPFLQIATNTIVKGDSIEPSIMAASILAKYSRDRCMQCFDLFYPQYGFAKHKGYPTKEHKKNILIYGLCDIHRKTFGSVKINE